VKEQQPLDIPTIAERDECLPSYASAGAAGADVRANLTENKVLPPGTSTLVPTGLRMAIPQGYEIQVRPRSGLALKHQVTVLNGPGTIDADYRGEVCVILINHGKNDFVIEPKMRIGQLVLAPVTLANFVSHTNLDSTVRGDGGFGHTGTH